MARGIHDVRYRKLIDALSEARRKAGLSQTELANRLGKRQQFVSKFELGERRLDVIEFAEVAQALDLSATDLLAEVVPR